MHLETLRNYCLSKPEVEETFPFGPDNLVYKVRGKIFLITGFDASPLQFSVKCNPEKAIELREEFPDTVLPGYLMNKKHWNTVMVNGVLSTQQLMGMIDESYNLVHG